MIRHRSRVREPSVPRPSSLFWAKGFADANIAAVGRTAFKLVGEFVLGLPSLTENLRKTGFLRRISASLSKELIRVWRDNTGWVN